MDLTTTTPNPPATPVPERSLNRQVVLEEDEYTAALSHIIARDFFPSLVHLDATNDYLDALNSRDPHLINASVRRLQEINTPVPTTRPWQTPSHTPYGAGSSETPLRTPRGEGPSKRPRFDTNVSLDDFQARYTSEDNSSFTHILDDENRKRREQWSWAWDAQKKVEGQRERLLEKRERMLIEPPPVTGVREKFTIEAPLPAGLITDGRESDVRAKEKSEEQEEAAEATQNAHGKQLSIVKPAPDEQSDVLAPQKDTRSAGVDAWKFKVSRNIQVLLL
jgi:protein DGCR14